MTLKSRIVRVIVTFIFQICTVYSESDKKSSLTFVIDDTGSMSDDIYEVKKGANAIFDTVMNSNSSQIADFVLVTFNDPSITYRITTADRDAFKAALATIEVHDGDDCPEMAMTGIERALQESRPRSYLYVFTDASAKDYRIYTKVKDLALKKESQVVFVLTGICGRNEDDPAHQVYYSLAAKTNGQVFHLDRRNEVEKVLNYVRETIKSRKTVIATKTFPSGFHKFDYNVDSDMKELVISVSGTNPSVEVTDSEGDDVPTEDILRTSRIAIVKVSEVKPGVYKAEVSSETMTSVVVAATTTVHFEYGFSALKPTSLEETANRPIPDEKSYLSIKLSTKEGTVDLEKAQILDMDENVIIETSLKVTDKEQQFYVTEPFVPPNFTFRLAIKGYDVKTKASITRISLTPIEPQPKGDTANKTPTVTLVGETKINAEYDEPLEIKCKISAHPKPDVSWEDTHGALLHSTLTLVELPYDYISVLYIDKVKENNTYTCKAKNSYGDDNKEVAIETIKKVYFDVGVTPVDTTIEIEKSAKFVCEVDAFPPSTIKWYTDGREIYTNSDFYVHGSSLLIKHMMPALDGRYRCEARNDYNKKDFVFKVTTTGVEPPIIDKEVTDVRALSGSDVDLNCRIIQGKPKPSIRWFFRHDNSEETTEIEEESVHIKNANRHDAGVYTCEAYNEVGLDDYNIYFTVQYPPTIKKSLKSIKAKDGERLRLRCVVDGVPTPEVKWFANGMEVFSTGRYHIHKSHSLNFKATLTDNGNYYTCVAKNELGTANKTMKIIVTVPPRIESPEQSLLEVNVGNSLELPCRATGSPKPDILWIFNSINPKIKATVMRTRDETGSLKIRRAQVGREGYYTCVAKNEGGNANITYEVRINAPPDIVNVYPEKTFSAVFGDIALRIPCTATGNPKPDITWSKDGLNIASGSSWYDIDKNGTLVIKNIDDGSSGDYVCLAKNSLGFDDETYKVIVDEYPKSGSPTKTVVIEEGKSSVIHCDVRHRRTDQLRWYKDGETIALGELNLKNVTISDTGLYTCRVSNFVRSQNGNTLVKVGYKPRFLYKEDKHIEFEEGSPAVMDCSAAGEPTPKVSWWHDRHEIDEVGMIYTFNMKIHDRGQYFCLIKNDFGYIVRPFEISSRECLLDLATDFNGNQPLLTSSDLKWPSYDNIDGYMRIPSGENILLSCPEGFTVFPKTEIMASCDRDTKFNIDGSTLKIAFSSLKCKKELTPATKETGYPCLPGNTEKIKVGFEVRDEFLEVYEVCLDKDKNIPLYAKQNIHRSIANADVKTKKWFDSKLLPFDFDEFYSCNLQIDTISSVLDRWFHGDDKCCFSKRQLVSPRDVPPGLSQTATYSYLNVVPQWSSCNAKNWESVEQRVRQLAKSTDHQLLLWTGTSSQLQLKAESSEMADINIIDKDSGQQPVSQYLWKVVQDAETKASLAIIQLNVPDVKLSAAYHHVHCKDICNDVPWMKSRSWRDVDQGYTYCCSVLDFEKAFGFEGLFNSGDGKVLYDVDIPPNALDSTLA